MGTLNYPSSYQDWVETVPQVIKESPVWPSVFYQKALFLYDLCWLNCEAWIQDRRGRAIGEQIIRSCGSISANIEEGYGRGLGREYARFLSFSVAAARETQGWYYRAHHLMKPDALDHRLKLCDENIAMLITAINAQKKQFPATRKR